MIGYEITEKETVKLNMLFKTYIYGIRPHKAICEPGMQTRLGMTNIDFGGNYSARSRSVFAVAHPAISQSSPFLWEVLRQFGMYRPTSYFAVHLSGRSMPVIFYQVADAAARDGKLENLLFIWKINEPKPISHGGDLGSYESKIAVLVPYMDNEHVRVAVMKMRDEIGKYNRATYGHLWTPRVR